LFSHLVSKRCLDAVDASFELSNVVPQQVDVVARRRDLLVEVTPRCDVTPADGWEQAHHRGGPLGAHVLLEPGEQLVAAMFADGHRRRSPSAGDRRRLDLGQGLRLSRTASVSDMGASGSIVERACCTFTDVG